MKTAKNRNLLISIFFCILISILCLYLFYPIESTPGFLFIITWIAHFAFLILGPILFVFRISGFLRREAFIYIFTGIANMWIGSFLYVLYFIKKVDDVVILAFLPNLLVGILLLADIYWPRTKASS